MRLIERILQQRIESRLKPNKVILLFGARRVGKTTLINQVVKKYGEKALVLNGEDNDAIVLLREKNISNYRNLLKGISLLVVDEAQNISEIGQKLKLIVDEIKGIRIIASGSSSFKLNYEAGEPLVGRSFTYLLFPFSQHELSAIETPLETKQKLGERLIYGSYPEVIHIGSNNEKREYLRDMVSAYLLKDILSIEGIRNANKMLDLLRLVAFQTGSEVSYDELGKQLGLSKNTVEKYLDLLAKVFIVFRLGAFSQNLRKEVTKSGKWYFYDNGIRNVLVADFTSLSLRKDIGQIWENYLISERLKNSHYKGDNSEFFFWRTYDGQEIDLIEKQERSLHSFEFKWSEKTARIPGAFSHAYPDAFFSVVHNENYLRWLGC